MLLDQKSRKWLAERFGACVRFAEPMANHTWLRVGGPADAWVRPESLDDLTSLVGWAREKRLPCLIVGDGTNLLVRDHGIRGLVVVLTQCLNGLEVSGGGQGAGVLSAQAGVRTQALCRFAISQGLAGLNFAVGIPGTVGGAIRMNAGTALGCLADVLVAIQVLQPDGEMIRIRREALSFGYRSLAWGNSNGLLQEGSIILGGDFGVARGDSGQLKREAEEIMNARRMTQPMGIPSAGCFFKNPPSGPSAGALIDQAGLKGKAIGGAEISTKHANFILNRDKASAAEILALVKLVQHTVSRKFNIDLQPEVKIVGAKTDP